jgi:hypothetical protein
MHADLLFRRLASIASWHTGHQAFALFHYVVAIDAWQGHGFLLSIGPANLNLRGVAGVDVLRRFGVLVN